MRAGGRIGSGPWEKSGECTRDRASALQLRLPRSVCDGKMESGKEQVPTGLSGVEPLRLPEELEIFMIGDDSERMVCSLQPVPATLLGQA